MANQRFQPGWPLNLPLPRRPCNAWLVGRVGYGFSPLHLAAGQASPRPESAAVANCSRHPVGRVQADSAATAPVACCAADPLLWVAARGAAASPRRQPLASAVCGCEACGRSAAACGRIGSDARGLVRWSPSIAQPSNDCRSGVDGQFEASAPAGGRTALWRSTRSRASDDLAVTSRPPA